MSSQTTLAPDVKTVKTPREVLQATKDRLEEIRDDQSREQWRHMREPCTWPEPEDSEERLEEIRALEDAIKRQEGVVAAKEAEEAGEVEEVKKDEDEDEDTMAVSDKRK